MKKAPAISVPLRKAQAVLSILRETELIDTKLEFCRTDKTLTIPLKQVPSDPVVSEVISRCSSARVTTSDFTESARPPSNLIEALNQNIPPHLLRYLPHSYDIVGDIAIVDLSEPIQAYASVVGKAIRQINPHLRLVTRKLGSVSGTYRTRNLENLAGTGNTETMHHEFSCTYLLDVRTVYFNPRLSNERMRIAEQVRNSEHVVDMFAGIGPFSILIAKMHPNVKLYACDINPIAVKYLNENILINRLVDRVIPVLGDAGQLSDRGLRAWADRIIMNLPSEARNYLPVALDLIGGRGIIHYYTFASRNERIEDIQVNVKDVIESAGRTIRSFAFAEAIREVAPGRVHVAIDLLVE